MGKINFAKLFKMTDLDRESVSLNSDEEAFRTLNPDEFKQKLILKEDELNSTLNRLKRNWTKKMGKDVSWSERCVLVHNEAIEQLDSSKVNDDTLREVQFYNIAKGNTTKALFYAKKKIFLWIDLKILWLRC